MSMEIPVAPLSTAAESGAMTEPIAISIRIKTALAVLFAVTAVVATSFVAALTWLL
jgi:hypothetical protein